MTGRGTHRTTLVGVYCAAVLTIAIVGVIALGPSYAQLFHLVQDGKRATGYVSDVRANNHAQFDWAFEVGGRSYKGTDVASHDGSPNITELAVGQPISVSFDPADPNNFCACDPHNE